MVAPTLNPEEYQFTDTGMVLNTDSVLPFVDITSIQGLDSAPARVNATTRDDIAGGWVDAVYEDIRTVTVEGTIYAVSDELETYLDILKANFAVGQGNQPLYFGTDVETRVVFAKALGMQYDKDSARRLGTINFQTQFQCEDPRIFSATLQTQNIPGSFNLSGNRDTVGTITIVGPSTPTISINGSTFTFTSAIPSGTTATIDLGQKTILGATNATPPVVANFRPGVTITGGWPLLQPGVNAFTGSSATVSARAAWR